MAACYGNNLQTYVPNLTYMPNFVWISGLKATGIFVLLLRWDGFKCDLETKFQRITSKNQFRSNYTQMFLKIFHTGVFPWILQNL